MVGKMFSLRGGVELRNVNTSQIKIELNPDRYVYTENVAKNGNGTFKPLHIKNKVIHEILSKMCALAGIEGRITNHSLRATSATQMYEMGVPEKIIQERTGHRSLDALLVYERTNTHQCVLANRNTATVPW